MATKLTIQELINKREEAQIQINKIISQLESDCDGCCVKINIDYVSSDTAQGEHRTNHAYVELVIS